MVCTYQGLPSSCQVWGTFLSVRHTHRHICACWTHLLTHSRVFGLPLHSRLSVGCTHQHTPEHIHEFWTHPSQASSGRGRGRDSTTRGKRGNRKLRRGNRRLFGEPRVLKHVRDKWRSPSRRRSRQLREVVSSPTAVHLSDIMCLSDSLRKSIPQQNRQLNI